MKRFFLYIFFVLACSVASVAQQSLLYSSQDAQFRNARDLYMQHKYTTSYRLLEQIDANQLTESEHVFGEVSYYLAANAYELRRADAAQRLEHYAATYPNTPYGSNAYFMMGVLYAERGEVSRALRAFGEVNKMELSKAWQSDYIFHLANAYVECKKYNEAVSLLSTFLKEESRYHLTAQYLHGYSLYSLGRYAEAEPVFLQIENSAAYSKIVPYYLVQIFHKKGDVEQVLVRADKLLKQNPKNPNNSEVHRVLGEIYYQQGQYGLAIDHLLDYERVSPTVLRNDLYILGLAFFQTEQYTEAIAYLSQVTSQNDVMAENAYLHIGNAYIKQDEVNNARMAYQSATLTKFDASVHEEALFNYALTTYKTSTALGESVDAFTTFLKQYPQSVHAPRAYELMVNVLMSSKNYRAAYDAIAHVPHSTPQLTEAKEYLLYQLGTDAFANADMAQAVDFFSRSIALRGSGKYRAEAYFWRSEAYYRMGQYEKSVFDLGQYFAQPNVRANKNYCLAHYSAGYSHFALKQYELALNFFLRYIAAESNKKAPSYADALNRTGDCYFNERNFVQADRYYAQVALLGADRADYAVFQRAYIYGLQKKYVEKVRLLEEQLRKYPNSELCDDALYEIARAHLMREDNEQAIAAYERLLTTYPNSNLACKTSLEIAMIYVNMKDYEHAITAYKRVVSTYAGTEEAFMALEGIESSYIYLNRVPDYIAYTKTLGSGVGSITTSKEDSLVYIAAENQYINKNYEVAAAGFTQYIDAYCPTGRYCVASHYYKATSYYRLDDKPAALDAYSALAAIQGNQYIEEAYTRCAELSYDLKHFAEAATYFKQLEQVASTTEKTHMARLGMLRCSRELKDYAAVIVAATQIVDDANSSEALLEEARYHRAKAYMAQKQNEAALPDLEVLAQELRTPIGAESKYLVAHIFFDAGDHIQSETVIMDFASKNTPQQYWLARSFVLLADIYMHKGEDFQAKQYLLSVQNNYKGNDEVHEMIKERLERIAEREEKLIETNVIEGDSIVID